MKKRPSVLNPEWLRAMGQWGPIKRLAAMAGYQAALPTRTRNSANRIGTNPNTSYAQMQRVQLQWDGEHLGKNTAFGTAYLKKRLMYCNPIGYIPDTGDSVLDSELRLYLDEKFKDAGINCSLYDAFGRVANVEQPCKGDSVLIWYRDESQYRLIEAGADQIGELYRFTFPEADQNGLIYFAGMFFIPGGRRTGFRIYDRGNMDYYFDPVEYPESDVLYFQDNLFRATRGVTIFHAIINEIYNTSELFDTGMAAAKKQAKTAAVVFNSLGEADETSYDTVVGDDGELTYVERTQDGPVMEYRYRGDGYQLIQTQAPGPELIEGCRYSDERASLGLGFPYSFMVNARDVGGASNRLEINIAGHEIERINKLLRPKLDKISYVFIMDAIDRKVFKPRPGITRGRWAFPNLPIADAFKDTQENIANIDAGLDTRSRVIGVNTGETFSQTVRTLMLEEVALRQAVSEGNKLLAEAGLDPDLTVEDLSQSQKQQQGGPQPVERPPQNVKKT